MENGYSKQNNIRSIALRINQLSKQQIFKQNKVLTLVHEIISGIDEDLNEDEACVIAKKLSKQGAYGFDLKSIVLCLSLRKLAKKHQNRMIKFGFFLIRSLAIDQKLDDYKSKKKFLTFNQK